MADCEKNRDLIIEQYKLYSNSIENVREKRFRLMQFYSSLLLGLIGLISLFTAIKTRFNSFVFSVYFGMIGLIGIILCIIWYIHIEAYTRENIRKLKILYELEKELPVFPFTEESEIRKQERKNKKFPGIIMIEKAVVFGFCFLFCTIYLLSLFLAFYAVL